MKPVYKPPPQKDSVAITRSTNILNSIKIIRKKKKKKNTIFFNMRVPTLLAVHTLWAIGIIKVFKKMFSCGIRK